MNYTRLKCEFVVTGASVYAKTNAMVLMVGGPETNIQGRYSKSTRALPPSPISCDNHVIQR